MRQATLIDFPQMISTSHANASQTFERDVNCIRTWFGKRFNFYSDDYPLFSSDVGPKHKELDISLAASGFSKVEAAHLEQVRRHRNSACSPISFHFFPFTFS